MKPAKKVKTHWIESFCQTRDTNSNHLDQQCPCYPEGQKLKWQNGLKAYSNEQKLVSNAGINNDFRISRKVKTGTSWITLPNKRHQHPILQKTLPKKLGDQKRNSLNWLKFYAETKALKSNIETSKAIVSQMAEEEITKKNWDPMQNKRYYHQWLGTPI